MHLSLQQCLTVFVLQIGRFVLECLGISNSLLYLFMYNDAGGKCLARQNEQQFVAFFTLELSFCQVQLKENTRYPREAGHYVTRICSLEQMYVICPYLVDKILQRISRASVFQKNSVYQLKKLANFITSVDNFCLANSQLFI